VVYAKPENLRRALRCLTLTCIFERGNTVSDDLGEAARRDAMPPAGLTYEKLIQDLIQRKCLTLMASIQPLGMRLSATGHSRLPSGSISIAVEMILRD
jgi:hypothetical protein